MVFFVFLVFLNRCKPVVARPVALEHQQQVHGTLEAKHTNCVPCRQEKSPAGRTVLGFDLPAAGVANVARGVPRKLSRLISIGALVD